MGLFSNLFSRRKENRSCPIPPDNPCYSAGLSNSLPHHYASDGLSLSPLFAAVNIISSSCGTLPWKFYDANGEELRKSHYLYHLFDNMTVSKFLSVKNAIRDVLINGNGFLYIVRNEENGKPMSLRYLPFTSVSMYRNDMLARVYYRCLYIKSSYILPEDMIHFKMHSLDGLIGIGVPFFASDTIETANYTEEAFSKYMSSGGQVNGILTPVSSAQLVNGIAVPTTSDQIAKIRTAWDDARRNNGTSTVILPADMKFQQMSTNARDAALIDSRLYNLTEICRFFNISPVLLGDLSHNQYGTLAEAQREFVQHTLQPFIVMMEEELNKKLIMPSKVGSEVIDLDEVAIMAIDKNKQAEYLVNLTTKGIMTANEARKDINLPVVDGADDLIIPFTSIEDNTVNKKKEDNNKNTNDNKDAEE